MAPQNRKDDQTKPRKSPPRQSERKCLNRLRERCRTFRLRNAQMLDKITQSSGTRETVSSDSSPVPVPDSPGGSLETPYHDEHIHDFSHCWSAKKFTPTRKKKVKLFMTLSREKPEEYGDFQSFQWLRSLVKFLKVGKRKNTVVSVRDIKHWIDRFPQYFEMDSGGSEPSSQPMMRPENMIPAASTSTLLGVSTIGSGVKLPLYESSSISAVDPVTLTTIVNWKREEALPSFWRQPVTAPVRFALNTDTPEEKYNGDLEVTVNYDSSEEETKVDVDEMASLEPVDMRLPKIEKKPELTPPKIEKKPELTPPKIEKKPELTPPKIEKKPELTPPKCEKEPEMIQPKIEKEAELTPPHGQKTEPEPMQVDDEDATLQPTEMEVDVKAALPLPPNNNGATMNEQMVSDVGPQPLYNNATVGQSQLPNPPGVACLHSYSGGANVDPFLSHADQLLSCRQDQYQPSINPAQTVDNDVKPPFPITHNEGRQYLPQGNLCLSSASPQTGQQQPGPLRAFYSAPQLIPTSIVSYQQQLPLATTQLYCPQPSLVNYDVTRVRYSGPPPVSNPIGSMNDPTFALPLPPIPETATINQQSNGNVNSGNQSGIRTGPKNDFCLLRTKDVKNIMNILRKAKNA